jgi:hypothetical protein
MSVPKVSATVKNKVPERMNRLEAGVKYSLGRQLVESVKQLLRTIIAHTPPFSGKRGSGGTPEADKSGKEAEARYIRSAFMPLSSEKFGNLIMARNDQALWNYQNIQWREQTCQDAWDERDLNRLHSIFQAAGWQEEENRTPYYDDISETQLNEILASQVSAIRSSSNPSVKAYVRDRALVEKLVIFRQKAVGQVAAGWKACLSQVGGKVEGAQAPSLAQVEKKGVEKEAVQEIKVSNNALKIPAISAYYEASLSEEDRKRLEEIRTQFKNQSTEDFRKTVRAVCSKEVQVLGGGTIKVEPDWVKKWCV